MTASTSVEKKVISIKFGLYSMLKGSQISATASAQLYEL